MANVRNYVRLCFILFLATLKICYTKLADGSECESGEQCDSGYCSTKRVTQKDWVTKVRPNVDRNLCCSRQYYESCSTSCTWRYLKACDPCCGRLICKDGKCGLDTYAIENHLTDWSEWTYIYSSGGENTRLQVCADERLQHRYRTAPDFYNYPTVEFKSLTHTTNCAIDTDCDEPECEETGSLSGETFKYMGCFYSERHFFSILVQLKPMDPLICRKYCKRHQGVRFYGVYHNSFCGCVDKIYSTKFAPIYRDERKCTEKCVGNSGQYCGGTNAANMYCNV